MKNVVYPQGMFRFHTLVFLSLCILWVGCNDQASRSSDDILICKQFINQALIQMQDLNRDTFNPNDLKFDELKHLTPSDPDWRDVQFLVLNKEWKRDENKTIVIFCGQSRVNAGGQRVHCVGYNTTETEWISESDLSKLQLADYFVLPHIRP